MRHTDTRHYEDGLGAHVVRTPVETIHSRRAQMGAVVILEDGDRIVIDGLNVFKMGSVVGSCIARGADPVEAVDHARANGHKLIWANPEAVVIYSGPRKAPEPVIELTLGMTIQFHGNLYTLERAPNRNLDLKLYAPVAAEVERREKEKA